MKPTLTFLNETHKTFFNETMEICNVCDWDTERAALIYVLGLNDTTRKYFDKIYDIKNGCICPEVLEEPFQTSGSTQLIKLAFNLFNNYTELSVLDLFAYVDCEVIPYLHQAIDLRLQRLIIKH